MKSLFFSCLLVFSAVSASAKDVSLNDETIIIAQMLTDLEVQKCIKQIESEYKGHFDIWLVVRRPKEPDVSYEDGSAALTSHSTYFFRGNVDGPSYKGPDAVAVDTNLGAAGFHYSCRIVNNIYK